MLTSRDECVTFALHTVPIVIHLNLLIHALPTTVARVVTQAVVIPRKYCSPGTAWDNESITYLAVGLEDQSV